MTTAPKCLFCFADIRKDTRTVYFKTKRETHMQDDSHVRYVIVDSLPLNIGACQKLTNEQVVSVRRNTAGISYCSTWDGRSYVDQYFCNGDHAKRFAYQAARAGFRC